VMDFRAHGQDLLNEWQAYRSARPRDNVFDIQRDKDELQRWANLLQSALLWESDDNRIAEACHQFELRLRLFKDKIVIELLTGGLA
jgi:hypothetical protein